MTNLTIKSEEINKEIIKTSLKDLFDFFTKNIIVNKKEKNTYINIFSYGVNKYKNNISDEILKDFTHIKKYKFLYSAKNMVFRLHYDFYVNDDKILIKPCISEENIIYESDFADKFLI